jgi:hypothetical protein
VEEKSALPAHRHDMADSQGSRRPPQGAGELAVRAHSHQQHPSRQAREIPEVRWDELTAWVDELKRDGQGPGALKRSPWSPIRAGRR